MCIVSAVLFILASITDSLDGKIARKHNLITDFGKFMDPLADKFMVIGALMCILYRFESIRLYVLIVTIIIVFRELAVTAARLVASTSGGVVIAANMLGKLKTVFQIIFISSVFIEPVLWKFAAKLIPALDFLTKVLYGFPVAFVAMAITTVLTVWSGLNYIKGCWKYINTEK
jgi:CDP-diacylglycerol--glycerol-3-phosphate 3-phosphatidyltransferase